MSVGVLACSLQARAGGIRAGQILADGDPACEEENHQAPDDCHGYHPITPLGPNPGAYAPTGGVVTSAPGVYGTG